MDHLSSTTAASVAVLTVSDSRTHDDDKSGALIMDLLKEAGHHIASREIVKDDGELIRSTMTSWIENRLIHIIIVTGGTGPAQSDMTPEVIMPMFDAMLPGFGELFRQLSYDDIGSAAMLSRAVAGWVDSGDFRTPIFVLPGSPKAVALAMNTLIIPQLGHLLDLCSLESSP
jgi:molybdenum cofactor biosynthesis protein B